MSKPITSDVYSHQRDHTRTAHVAGSGPLLLLVHGWPELSYSWRHQIEPLGAGRIYRLRHRRAGLRQKRPTRPR